MAAEFEHEPPPPGASPVQLLDWASKVTNSAIAATWRPGHTEHAPLLVRLDNGREIFFETINEATSAKRFFAAFIAVGCVPMRAYSEPQVRMIASALVRAAQLSDELDERDFWEETGSTFLRACLLGSAPQTITLAPDTDQARHARYSTATRYDAELGRLYEEAPPRALVAVDTEQLLLPRGPFLTYVGRRRRGQSPGTVNAQMRRVGWDLYELRPRKPEAPRDYPRPHVRLWAIPNGWDGHHVEIKAGEVVRIAAELGPVVPPGPAEHARPRDARSWKRDPAGPRDPGFEDQETGT